MENHHCINQMLSFHGERRLHETTLHALLQHGKGGAPLTPHGHNIVDMLLKIAPTLRVPSCTDWAYSISYKLRCVGYHSLSDISERANLINITLTRAGFKRLHTCTIGVITNRAIGHSDRANLCKSGEVDTHDLRKSGEVDRKSREVDRKSREVSGNLNDLRKSREVNNPPNGATTHLQTSVKPADTYTYSGAVHATIERFKLSGDQMDMDCVLLDSGSSIHVFANGDLLENIRDAPNHKHININTLAGTAVTCQQGDLPGVRTVWYHPEGIANVLSMGIVSMDLRITMDTSVDNAIIVHKTDGTIRRFGLTTTGLYLSNLGDYSGSLLTITTIEDQKMKYSALDVQRADAAQRLQLAIGHPSTAEFIRIVKTNLLGSCGTTRKDILTAEKIQGPSTSVLKGKTTTPLTQHVREEIIETPLFVLENYKKVTLCIDIFYVNGIPFVTSISRHIYFATAEAVYNAKVNTLSRCIKSIINQYERRGLQVDTIIADNQFDCTKEHVDKVNFIPLTKDEHEKFVERNIRFIKDRCHCIYNKLPYKRIPKRMTIRMVYTAVFWINAFPQKEGISDTISPRTIMTGLKPTMAHAKYQFGEYFQTHETSRNDMTECTLDAIFVGPVGNPQGGFYVSNLSTGEQIKRLRATPLPVSDAVIARVHQLADRNKTNSGLLFGDRHGNTTILDVETMSIVEDDNASDSNYSKESSLGDISLLSDRTTPDDDAQMGQDQNNYYSAISAQSNNDDDENKSQDDTAADEEGADAGHTPDSDAEVSIAQDALDNPPAAEADAITHEAVDPQGPRERDNQVGTSNMESDAQSTSEGATDTENQDPVNNDTSTIGRRSAGYIHPVTGERTRKSTRGWSNALTAFENVQELRKLTSGHTTKYGLIDYIQRDTPKDENNGLNAYVNHMLLTQFGIKKGLELFEQEGVNAVLKELRQMHTMEVVEPLHPGIVTKEMRARALNYLMFLKRKKSGVVKGRGCADGRKQQVYVPKEDAAAPTVGTPV